MRYFLLLFICFITHANAQQHCGYDFTSYIVLHVHEDGKKENIGNLKITLVDSLGNDIVNTANKFSWKMKDQVMQFSENYKIDDAGNKIENETGGQKFRWFFPFAKDVYLLSVTNEFPADLMQVRIEDPNNVYQTTILQLYAYNMYILCTSQAQQQAQQFGPRVNKPVEVVMTKRK